MRLGRSRRSSNIEDRRGSGGGFGVGTGRGMRVGKVAGGGGIGVIIIALIAMFFGIDPGLILGLGGGGGGGFVQQTQEPAGTPSAQDGRADFVAAVLGETEDVWKPVFRERGLEYREPTLVLFEGQVASACGMASSAAGPFYCPGDQKVYIDLSFFDDLKSRFGAPGDFAQAYVVAHEVGHHVQTLLGISKQVQDIRGRVSKAEGNRYSVMLELQADCFSGVWARRAHEERQILEKGDVREGLNAAAAIGDDRLQKQSRGYVVPDSFTHGSSDQRVEWFETGLQSGDIESCDTFNAGI
ncbi:MAG: neutral zinc metallopeptidase [Geminicoccaceae bacterium]|nr:neutral zinc metallopeptidase [Geminicoccaceae bacterium]